MKLVREKKIDPEHMVIRIENNIITETYFTDDTVLKMSNLDRIKIFVNSAIFILKQHYL